MKSKAHIYMANLIIKELESGKGYVKFKSSANRSWPCKSRYKIPTDVEKAIRTCPSFFRAGAIGPDFFPDMILGQMDIHPSYSGKWLTHMHEMLKKMMPYTNEYYQSLAFYLGYSMHYACDMYGHDNINLYAGGWFPDITGIASSFMDGRVMEASENAKKIVRHVMVESYLDDKVQGDLTIDIPYGYLRMCYGSAEAVAFADEMRKMSSSQRKGHYDRRGNFIEDKSGDSNGKFSSFNTDFLKSFVDKYNIELRKLRDGYSTVKKVEAREQYIVKWIDTWYQFARVMLEPDKGTGAAIKYCLTDLLVFMVDCFDSLSDSDKKKYQKFIRDIKEIKDIFDKIEIPLIGDILDFLLDVTIKKPVKKLLYPYVKNIAEWLYSLVNVKVQCKDYDECIKKIKGFVTEKALFMNTRGGLFAEWNDKADQLYRNNKNFKNFVDKNKGRKSGAGYFTLYLDYMWGNFGAKNANSLNQNYKEFQSCLNMGKLCLLGVNDLNGIIAALDGKEKRRFDAERVVFSVRRIGILLRVSKKSTADSSGSLVVGIGQKYRGYEQPVPKTSFRKGEEAMLSLTLERVVPVDDIKSFTFRMSQCDNLICDYMTVFDEDTGVILASVTHQFEINKCRILVVPSGAFLSEDYYGAMKEIRENNKRPVFLSDVCAVLEYNGSSIVNAITFTFESKDGRVYSCSKTLSFAGQIILDLKNVNIVFSQLKSMRISCLQKINIRKLFLFDFAGASGGSSYCFGRLLNVSLNAGSSHNIDFVEYDSCYRDKRFLDWKMKDISVIIKTANKKYAGTDGDVYFEVYDNNGTKIKQKLFDKDGNDFEKGDRDIYGISLDSAMPPRNVNKFRVRLKEIWCADDWTYAYFFAFDSQTGQVIFADRNGRELTKKETYEEISTGPWRDYDENPPETYNPYLNS